MKIAFILSGQPRFYKQSFPIIKEKILDIYNCDIYAHAWWSEEEVNEKPFLPPWTKNLNFKLDKDFPLNFKNLYNPKKLTIEASLIKSDLNKDNLEKFHIEVKKNYPDMDTSYYEYDMIAPFHKMISIEKAYNLVDWSVNYDWIVFWRYDMIPINFLNLQKINENAVHAYRDQYDTFINRPDLVCPHFIDTAFVLHPKSKDILKIATFFSNLKSNKIIVEKFNKNNVKYTTAEIVWAANALYHNVPVIHHTYNDFTAKILRSEI